jgi:hypothetical protein
MNIHITKTKGGKSYNSDHQEVIKCNTGCGRLTTMTGTGLCDHCWEKSRRIKQQEAY